MANRNRFTHTEVKGTERCQRAAYHGFCGDAVGENTYMFSGSSKGFRNDWDNRDLTRF